MNNDKCEGGVEHTPFVDPEELTPELLETLLVKNGVPAKPCNVCKVCYAFYPIEDERQP